MCLRKAQVKGPHDHLSSQPRSAPPQPPTPSPLYSVPCSLAGSWPLLLLTLFQHNPFSQQHTDTQPSRASAHIARGLTLAAGTPERGGGAGSVGEGRLRTGWEAPQVAHLWQAALERSTADLCVTS